MTRHVCVGPSDVLQSFTDPSSSAEGASRPQPLLRLPHPRTGLPSLFLVDENAASSSKNTTGILEVQAVAPDIERSWFMSDDNVVSDGRLLMLTPMDPVFLVLRVILAVLPQNEAKVIPFRPLDDIFEDAANHIHEASFKAQEASPTLQVISREDVMALANIACIRPAMARVCEVKEVTEDITVYRYSASKLLEVLRRKVNLISDPANFDSFQVLARGLSKNGLVLQLGDQKEELRQLARIRGACEVVSQYLPQSIYDQLLTSYDFTELDKHVKAILEEEASAAAAAMAKENESKASKGSDKAKKAKGKNAESRGLQQLAKTNTQGMAKLTTFFTKKEKAK